MAKFLILLANEREASSRHCPQRRYIHANVSTTIRRSAAATVNIWVFNGASDCYFAHRRHLHSRGLILRESFRLLYSEQRFLYIADYRRLQSAVNSLVRSSCWLCSFLSAPAQRVASGHWSQSPTSPILSAVFVGSSWVEALKMLRQFAGLFCMHEAELVAVSARIALAAMIEREGQLYLAHPPPRRSLPETKLRPTHPQE